MHFHFNLRRGTRFMQRIENICSSFSYFLLSFLSTWFLHLPFFSPLILSSRQIYTICDPYHLKRTLVETNRPCQTSVLRTVLFLYLRRNIATVSMLYNMEEMLSTFEIPSHLRHGTSMAIKWTMLTIQQFSISWNFNGIYNIAMSGKYKSPSSP